MTFLIHRWLGIALALLMALWTLSGFVMMYVSYPETTDAERAAGLQPLDLHGCCGETLLPEEPVESASVEMIEGFPVVRWIGPNGPDLFGIGVGAPIIGKTEALGIAQTHWLNTHRLNLRDTPTMNVTPVSVDQWTLQQQRYAPLFKVTFEDDQGTELYVSGLTGQVVQDTHRSERFWNWLGAVPHWLYFTPLRKDGTLWSNLVIYASLLGTFLTLTGIYVGLRMYGRGKKKSPFRGAALWHHWTGLIFGLVTLTWVFSGFASMQPWGWLESQGPGVEQQAMAGRPIAGADVEALYRALAAHPQPGVVSAEVAVQSGKAYAILVRRDGSRTRATLLDLAPAPLTMADLEIKAREARQGAPIASHGLVTEGDAYHYDHHSTPAILPAYRVIYADPGATRLYFDPRTGELIDYVDAGSRSFRWWHSGLHRLDIAGLRERPLWDVVMWVLLTGVALVCLLGVWMGWRRLTRRERLQRAR